MLKGLFATACQYVAANRGAMLREPAHHVPRNPEQMPARHFKLRFS